ETRNPQKSRVYRQAICRRPCVTLLCFLVRHDLGATRLGDKTCVSTAVVSSQGVQSPHKPFDRERSSAHPGRPMAHNVSRVAAKTLYFGAKSRYMQRNGPKTLHVVGRAGQ